MADDTLRRIESLEEQMTDVRIAQAEMKTDLSHIKINTGKIVKSEEARQERAAYTRIKVIVGIVVGTILMLGNFAMTLLIAATK